jgi:hypothetical protein
MTDTPAPREEEVQFILLLEDLGQARDVMRQMMNDLPEEFLAMEVEQQREILDLLKKLRAAARSTAESIQAFVESREEA